MKFIGITGGVGAGKSEILSYLQKKQGVRVMLADEIAHDLMEPGTSCYTILEETFRNEDIWNADRNFDKEKLARVIFADKKKRDIFFNISLLYSRSAQKGRVFEQINSILIAFKQASQQTPAAHLGTSPGTA